jgi:hypothetical protein
MSNTICNLTDHNSKCKMPYWDVIDKQGIHVQASGNIEIVTEERLILYNISYTDLICR